MERRRKKRSCERWRGGERVRDGSVVVWGMSTSTVGRLGRVDGIGEGMEEERKKKERED